MNKVRRECSPLPRGSRHLTSTRRSGSNPSVGPNPIQAPGSKAGVGDRCAAHSEGPLSRPGPWPQVAPALASRACPAAGSPTGPAGKRRAHASGSAPLRGVLTWEVCPGEFPRRRPDPHPQGGRAGARPHGGRALCDVPGPAPGAVPARARPRCACARTAPGARKRRVGPSSAAEAGATAELVRWRRLPCRPSTPTPSRTPWT